MYLNPLQKVQGVIASILPGWKTVTLAGGLGLVNLLDWLQMNYQAIPGLENLIPEPYKTVINVVVPALIMWVRNISQRADAARIAGAKIPD